MYRTEERLAKIDYVVRHRQPDLTVVIENVHDPHNVSAILRSCDAVGVLGIQLVYTTCDFPDISKKSSSSASKWIELREFTSIDACYAKLHEEGFAIYATCLRPGTKDLYDLDLRRPTALVFGNEHAGVSDEAAEKADAMLQIPMHGFIQSLNVSVACAVTLFETLRQRRAAGDLDAPKFSDEGVRALTERWARM